MSSEDDLSVTLAVDAAAFTGSLERASESLRAVRDQLNALDLEVADDE